MCFGIRKKSKKIPVHILLLILTHFKLDNKFFRGFNASALLRFNKISSRPLGPPWKSHLRNNSLGPYHLEKAQTFSNENQLEPLSFCFFAFPPLATFCCMRDKCSIIWKIPHRFAVGSKWKHYGNLENLKTLN